MPNFIVTYDLNGPRPSHKEMDEHLAKLPGVRGRILETVWFVQTDGTPADLRNYVKQILSPNDLLFVVRGRGAAWTKTLLDNASLKECWDRGA